MFTGTWGEGVTIFSHEGMMTTCRSAMILEQTGGFKNRCRARQFLSFSDSTHTLDTRSIQHAFIGHEAMVGCLVRISMPKDVLPSWKIYLLTQRWENKNTHINLTGLTHLVSSEPSRWPLFPRRDSNPISALGLYRWTSLLKTSPRGEVWRKQKSRKQLTIPT